MVDQEETYLKEVVLPLKIINHTEDQEYYINKKIHITDAILRHIKYGHPLKLS